jgi:hypothetical protein
LPFPFTDITFLKAAPRTAKFFSKPPHEILI